MVYIILYVDLGKRSANWWP